ncbi:uncharacterized protein B0I36DRAFT_366304 [Microdochium trichocladiopsis]|uniref:Rhodopsin domain-containing protein n=1 Tax=Microdochium trichocladiopsis TaxID=1682393 RepID=A0A9P9BIL1_9PEZI|nr:uncharacterized protein B0I36DRAFT_366304 [Microdochium trichocladiopsis]KAH7024353.1 hypothetical protein B0I36DRAFT_366304 [Microdochium trichocladiopsis]
MAGALDWISKPEETRAPLIEGVTFALLSVSTVALGLRLWLRWKYSKLQADDLCLTFAHVCQIAFSVTLEFQISKGFGKHGLDVPFSNLNLAATYGLSNITILTVGTTVAKISFALTLLNLANSLWKWINWVIWAIIVTLVVFAAPVATLPWIQCKPLAKVVIDFLPGTCINKAPTVNLGIFQGVYSGIMDFLLAMMPWKIIWSLQMRPVEKFGVGIAMSLGCLGGVMAFMRASEVPGLATKDPSYDGVLAVMWGEIELATTIIAACIPALRRLIHNKTGSSHKRTEDGRDRSGGSSAAAGSKRSRPSRTHTIVATPEFSGSNTYEMEAISHKGDSGDEHASCNNAADNERSKKHNSTSSKWYSIYERDTARNSDESVILAEHGER